MGRNAKLIAAALATMVTATEGETTAAALAREIGGQACVSGLLEARAPDVLQVFAVNR